MSAISNPTTPFKQKVYDCATRDFARALAGELIGYARTVHVAERQPDHAGYARLPAVSRPAVRP